MKTVEEIVRNMMEVAQRIEASNTAPSLSDVCPKCDGRRFIEVERDGYKLARDCECEIRRKSLERIEKSGMGGLLETCTFDAYKTKTAWQKRVKTAAQAFCDDYKGNWFYIGGAVGSGKTHICTAIVGELIRRGMNARYMLWRTDARKLKACVNEAAEYDRLMSRFDRVKVLYIDDFLKTKAGERPSAGDINLAFELLNYRYVNPHLVTIISCERTIEDLLDVDEGVGSRIRQRTKKYSFAVRGENYRLL